MTDNTHINGNISRDEMSAEVTRFVTQLNENDPKKLQFAILVTGHEDDKRGGTDVLSLSTGQPDTLAKALLMVIDKLVESTPEFAVHFLLGTMARAAKATALPEHTATEVASLLDKIKNKPY